MANKRAGTAKAIAEQLDRMLATKQLQAEPIGHNLEKGLGNEEALREVLRSFLPKKFGVAKGKVTNASGAMSKHVDVIIYDAVECPSLFVDENDNQILPIERVYGCIEVKTTLSSASMEEAFSNLKSVHDLRNRVDASTNDYQWICPPWLDIFAFHDSRSLLAIARQYDRLSRTPAYEVRRSYSSYSDKSPAFTGHTGRQFLVSSIHIMGKGLVHHMLDGSVHFYDWGPYTLGMFLAGIVDDGELVKLPNLYMRAYLNLFMIEEWRGLQHTKRAVNLWPKRKR